MDQGLSNRTTAGIVTFHPDQAQLRRLVSAVAPGLREVIVFANSDLPREEEEHLAGAASPTPCRVLRPSGNVGLGAAYDAFLEAAREAGDRYVLLLDQDSLPPDGASADLADLHARLLASGERPAIVGPQPIDPEGHRLRIATHELPSPPALADEAIRAQFVISSGSLVDVEAAASIGPFRADFFIDAIDLEWCFRANALGFSIWVAKQVTMDHSLGRGVIRIPLLGLHLVDQPPRRLYTYLRNQLAMMRLAHVPVGHKTKLALTLPARIVIYLFKNRFSKEARSAIRNGLVDGLASRLGPPDRALR